MATLREGRKLRILALAAIPVLLCGCFTGPKYRLAVVEPAQGYEPLGYAEAEATGFLILGIFQDEVNNTIERAVARAIESKSGDELVDITVVQQWWYGGPVTGFTVKVRGMVLRDLAGIDARRERIIKQRAEPPDHRPELWPAP